MTRERRTWISIIVVWVALLGSIALGRTYPALDTIWVGLRLLLVLVFSIFFLVSLFRSGFSPRGEGVASSFYDGWIDWWRGGYSDREVDVAGKQLLETLGPRIEMAMAKNPTPTASCHLDVRTRAFSVNDPAYRASITGGQMVHVGIVTPPPDNATIVRTYLLLLPRDADGKDTILLKNENDATDVFSVRLSDVIPLSAMALTRLGSFADRIVREMLATPKEVSTRSVQNAG
jgi:hypothetical protein